MMNWKKFFIPLVAVGIAIWAYLILGGQGLAFFATLAVMWLLLHFTRLIQVLKRAAKNPIGSVGSAVKLNAKLRNKLSLLHVIAMTRSLGELQPAVDSKQEVYTWQDASQSVVRCVFVNGQLQSWSLTRPNESQSSEQMVEAKP